MKYYPETEASWSSWEFEEFGLMYAKDSNTIIVFDSDPPSARDDFPHRKMTQKDQQKLIRFLFTLPVVDERRTS